MRIALRTLETPATRAMDFSQADGIVASATSYNGQNFQIFELHPITPPQTQSTIHGLHFIIISYPYSGLLMMDSTDVRLLVLHVQYFWTAYSV